MNDSDQKENLAEVKTIVVVEDNESIGEFLLQAIQKETPYQVVLASNGLDTLKTIRTLQPDLLILDYDLPDMNGIELYDTIHAAKALENVPALMVTAQAIQKEVKARHLRLLKKPFELTDLLAEIERLLA